jgi:hypothetical protein
MSDQNMAPEPKVDLTTRVNPAADSTSGVERRWASTVGAVLDAVAVGVAEAVGVSVGVGPAVPDGVAVGVAEGVGVGVSACP